MKRLVVLAAVILGAAACSGGSSSVSGSKQAYCAKVKSFQALGDTLGGNQDLGKAVDLLKGFKDVVAAAPAEIKPDVAVLNEAIQKLAGALANVDPNDSNALFAAVFGALADFDQDTLAASATKVHDYTKKECSIDLDLSAFGSTSGSSTTTTDLFSQFTTTSGSSATTTTTVAETTTTQVSSATTGDVNALPDPEAVPGGSDAHLNDLAQKCHDGDMQACDDLFSESDPGSAYEDYGNTCGGRIPNNAEYCVDVYPTN